MTIATNQGDFVGYSASDATLDCWAGAGKTRVYLAMPHITWTSPRLSSGGVSEKASS